MSPDDKRHGTYAGYVAHNKTKTPTCDDCYRAARRFRKVARLEAHRGNPRKVPLGEEAWRIVNTTTPEHLARHGISLSTCFRLRKLGPDTLVWRNTRDAILAARLPTAIGVQRRLRALAVIGWSMRAIGHEIGSTYADNLRDLLLRQQVRYVRQEMTDQIVAVYDRLHMTPAPDSRSASRARNRAVREGWAPPLAWDNIDDPNEKPIRGNRGEWLSPGEAEELRQYRRTKHAPVDPNVVDRVLSGEWSLYANPAERAEICRRFIERGGSTHELERLSGWRVARYYRKGDAA